MMAYFKNTLAGRVASSMAIVSAVAILLLGLGSWLISEYQQRVVYQALIKKELELQGTQFSSRLRSVADRLAAIANSSLLATALVDSAGKDLYLVPFLRGVQAIDGIPVQILFTDLEAEKIASNGAGAFSVSEIAWLKQRLIKTKSGSTIIKGNDGTPYLLAAELLTYVTTKEPQGALLYKIKLDDLTQSLKAVVFVDTDRCGLVLKSQLANCARQSGKALELRVDSPKIFSDLNLSIFIDNNHLTFQRNTWQLASIYVAGSVFAVIFILFFARLLAERVTKDFRTLAEFSSQVLREGSTPKRLKLNSLDEVKQVADSVNVMLDRLSEQHAKLKADSESRFKRLFDEILTGFALHEVIPCSDGEGLTFRYLEVNREF